MSEIIEIIADNANKFSKFIFVKPKTGPSSSISTKYKCIVEATANEIMI